MKGICVLRFFGDFLDYQLVKATESKRKTESLFLLFKEVKRKSVRAKKAYCKEVKESIGPRNKK